LHWVTSSLFVYDVFDARWLFTDGGRRDDHVNLVLFKCVGPLRDQHASNLLSLSHLLVVLFEFGGEQEVAKHNSALDVQSELLRAYPTNVVKEILVAGVVGLRAVLESIKSSQVGCRFSRDKGVVKREAVLHQRNRDSLNDGTLLLKHLDCQLLNVSVSVVQLCDVEFVKDTDAKTFEGSGRIKLTVSHSLNVSDLVQVAEVDTVGVVLVWALNRVEK